MLDRKKIIVKTVSRASLLYKENGRKMYVSFEWVTPNGATQIDSYSVKSWEAPHEHEEVSDEEKMRILENIKKELERQGCVVRFY